MNKRKSEIKVSMTGCLYAIILFGLAGITVKECKRADLRLKEQQLKYEQIKNLQRTDTINYNQRSK